MQEDEGIEDREGVRGALHRLDKVSPIVAMVQTQRGHVYVGGVEGQGRAAVPGVRASAVARLSSLTMRLTFRA